MSNSLHRKRALQAALLLLLLTAGATNAFALCDENTLLYSYDDVTHTATVTGYDGQCSGQLVIPATVTKDEVEYTVTAVGDNAFLRCSGLTGVTFPASLTTLGQFAFRECNDLTSVEIPSTLTNIGDGAFLWCTSLAEVTLPDNMTHIGKYMFEGAAFTEIELPSSLQVIEKLAFYATSLETVTLPASVTSIGEMAFKDCLDLQYVVALPTTPPTIYANSFEDVEGLPLYVKAEAYDAYRDHAVWNEIFDLSSRPGLIYNTEVTTATVSGCTANYVGALEIPSTFGDKTVVGIEDFAFKDQPYITSASIPSTVESIGGRAFQNCPSLASFTVDAENESYKSVDGVLFDKAGTTLLDYPAARAAVSYDLPYDVSAIALYAFSGSNNLTSINLSAALSMEHPYHSLYGLPNLTAITVDGGSTNYKAVDGVLFNYDQTQLLYCPQGKSGNYTVPASVTTIGWQAFGFCKALTGITINNTVTDIKGMTFYECASLGKITLPSTITTIKGSTFAYCSNLKSVTFLGNVTTIESGAFYSSGLISVTLPASVTSIEESAYMRCANLAEITCEAVTPPTTAGNAFSGIDDDIPVYVPAASVSAYQAATGWSQFTNIQAITNPNSYLTYTYDDDNLTATVTGLTDNTLTGGLTIPGTVTHDNKTYVVTAIADNAFKDCTGLTSVNIAHTVETIGAYALSGCTGLTELTIGRNVKTIGAYAFEDCIGLTAVHYYATNCETVSEFAWSITNYDLIYVANKTLDIKNCVQSLPACCFYSLKGLGNATVTIPDNVASIGDWAFRYCDLKGISIGSGVTTIGKYAFEFSGLQSVELPSNVTGIGTYAFKNCQSLTSATVWGAKRISVGMFKNCTALTSFDVKSATRMINSHAFANCTSLATLTTAGYASNLTAIGTQAFSGCTALTAIDLPNSVTTIQEQAFGGCNNVTTLTLGTGVASIGSAAFYYCSSLATVNYYATHCSSVSTLVWSGVNNVQTLNIGANVEVIPSRAFENMKGFTSVSLPNGLTEIDYNAFNGCGLTTLTIPNNVTWIGSEAFYGNPLTEITSYNTTPPSITSTTFHSDAYSQATLKVLGDDAVTAYSTADYWKNFNTIQSVDGYFFTTAGNWSTAANWEGNSKPSNYDPENPGDMFVLVLANATIDEDVQVRDLNITSGNVVTVPSGKKLAIYNSLISNDASALVIQEGGNLLHASDVQATMEKNITGYSGNRSGYYFLSSPLKGDHLVEYQYYYAEPSEIENLLSGTYDLYLFDQTQYQVEWQNYKANPSSFHIRRGQGYLYANQAETTTLKFAGTMEANMDGMGNLWNQEVSLSFDDDAPLKGWNFIGNPFAGTAYLVDNYGAVSGFYMMNEAGNGFEPYESFATTAIPSCTGIFVKTEQDYSSVAFTMQDPQEQANNGGLNITLSEAVAERGVSTGSTAVIDKAIVSFNEGSRLEKFVFNADNAKISILQNGTDYAIAWSDANGEMPLNFKATRNGSYTLTIAPNEVEMRYLHLIDNLTGKDVDLLETPYYTFNGKASDYASRFKLVYAAGSNENLGDDFVFISDGNLIVTGQGTLNVYDVLGRKVFSGEISTFHAPLSTFHFTDGVYVLQLVNGNNVKTQKIVVK